MPHKKVHLSILLADQAVQWLEKPASIPRVSDRLRSEFSVVFSKTRVNTGKNPLERPHGGHSTHWPRFLVTQSALKPTTNQPTDLKRTQDVFLKSNSFILRYNLRIIFMQLSIKVFHLLIETTTVFFSS